MSLGPWDDPFDRPPCWVHHQGVWCPGRIQQWFPGPSGWTAMVAYEAGGSGYYQVVPAEHLADGHKPRPDDGDNRDLAPPWDGQGPPWLQSGN